MYDVRVYNKDTKKFFNKKIDSPFLLRLYLNKMRHSVKFRVCFINKKY